MEMDKEESSVQHPRKSLRKRKAPVSVFDGEMIRGDLASFACKGRVFQEPSKALAKSMDSTHGKAEASLDKLDAHLARLAARLRRAAAAAAAPPPAGPGGQGEGEGEGGGGARLLGNPAAFAAVDFQPVEEVAHDAPGAGARAHAARRAGTPLVVRGPPPEEGWWAPFARPWLVAPPPPPPRRRRRRGEGEGEGEAEEAGAAAAPPAELDAAAMLRGGLGREIVPVVVRRYSQADPIHHQERLSTFLAESWGPGKAKYYLHQWQFPLSAAAARRLPAPAWHAPCARFLGGPDLLEFASRDPARGGRFTGVSPYQYLFMGAAGTGSKLHRDLGGLAVTIAPLVGEKEVTLVHRDEDGAGLAGQHVDAWRPKAAGGGGGGGGDGDEGGGAAAPGLARYPGLAFARCWRTTLRPGQILIVPAGTWHAARNPAPCLAYSRLHLGEAELPALARSLADQDAPEINHKLILWNALYGLSNRVLKRQDLIAVPQETSSLLALFHLCRALLPQLKAEADERKWEALVQIIENRINGEMDETQVKLEDLDSPCNWSYDASHAKRHNAGANGTVERLYEDRATNGDDENGDHTVVRIDGMNCKQGDRVKIKFFKRKLLGQVLAVREAQGAGATGGRGDPEGASGGGGGGGGGGEGASPPGRGVDVHYDGFPRYHDELRPAEAVFERRPAPKGQGGVRAGPVVPWERLVPGLAVCVPWGKPQEMFYATVKSKYSGRMISVHYDQFGEDWDQWVKPHEIIPI